MFERDSATCPECLSHNTVVNKHRITAAGLKYVTLQCKDCGKYFSVSETKYDKALQAKHE
jgi:transcription elongation factor Elf1